MTLKKMVALYLDYEISDDTYEMFRQMALHGLIKQDMWDRFWRLVKSWAWVDDIEYVIGDVHPDGSYTVIARRNADGRMVRCAE